MSRIKICPIRIKSALPKDMFRQLKVFTIPLKSKDKRAYTHEGYEKGKRKASNTYSLFRLPIFKKHLLIGGIQERLPCINKI